MAFDEGSLDAIDDHAPHAELAHDLVERPSANEEFLGCVRYKTPASALSESAPGLKDALKPYSVAPRIIKASPLPLSTAA